MNCWQTAALIKARQNTLCEVNGMPCPARVIEVMSALQIRLGNNAPRHGR